MADEEEATYRKHQESQCLDRMKAAGNRVDDLEKLLGREISWVRSQLATDKDALDKRLVAMNEMRGALGDLGQKMFTKEAHEAYQREQGIYREAVQKDIRELREWRSELAGARVEIQTKASQFSALMATLIGAAALLISLVTLIKGFIR
jgi:uncharacterized protein YukE